MRAFLHGLLADRRAATAIEYALIAAIMAVGAIMGVAAFGDSLDTLWRFVGDEVTGAMDGDAGAGDDGGGGGG